MRLKNINAEISFELWMISTVLDELPRLGLGTISLNRDDQTYRLKIENENYRVKLQDPAKSNDLNFYLKRGSAHLVEVLEQAKDNSVFLKIIFFSGDIIEMGDIEIGIDQNTVNNIKRKNIHFKEIEELSNLFVKKFTLNVSGKSYFIIYAGHSSKNDFEYQENQAKENSEQENLQPEVVIKQEFRSFSLCGDGISIPVEKRVLSEFDEIFQVTKVIFRENNQFNSAIRLVRGKLTFSSTPTKIQALAAGAMRRLTNENGSYLKQWDKYGAIEGQMLLKRAKSIGRIEYVRHNTLNNAVEFFVDAFYKVNEIGLEKLTNSKKNIPKNIISSLEELIYQSPKTKSEFSDLVKTKISEEDYQLYKEEIIKQANILKHLSLEDQLELTEEAPIYIRNPKITWEEYSAVLEEEFFLGNDKGKNQEKKTDETVELFASILDISNNSITLQLPRNPDKKVFFILSINGDKTQIERRMQARSSILEGRSANPLLGLLIEEGGVLPEIKYTHKMKPLSPFVEQKIFKHPPTEKQLKAISVALNTPDIALIQGPPGTGKTTVVTAILERLNEEFDKTASIRGKILVSGFQHDAVENIIARLSVNALPAIKFGKRAADSLFTESAVTEKLNQWCTKVASNIREKNPTIKETEEQLRLTELFAAYSLNPSKNNTINLMQRVLNLPTDLLTSDLQNEAQSIIDSLDAESQLSDPTTLRLIRAMRVSEAAFQDDGASRASDLLNAIEKELNPEDIALLENAADWRVGKEIDFLPKLRVLKELLLYRFLPSPDFQIEKTRDDVLKIIASVQSLLKTKNSTQNKQEAILAEFLHELEGNPDGVREAIEDYSFVYAATTQQAVGKDITRSKNKIFQYSQAPKMTKYDTVIIDEAARASPRDLLIPMSLAEKRIILVGDHRQLPHIIDEEIAKNLETEGGAELSLNNDFVKKSMFEYLFERMKKLEAAGGPPRTVTLDAQYRTHPVLGNFCSDNFYEKNNEAYRSPLTKKRMDQWDAEHSKSCIKLKTDCKKCQTSSFESSFGFQLTGVENDSPAVWFKVPNIKGKEVRQTNGSRKRYAEAKLIAEYLAKWIKQPENQHLSFGVISFYKAQVNEVFQALSEYKIAENDNGKWQINERFRLFENGEERIRIGTVDAFQGMEFDIVLLSIVRTQQDLITLERETLSLRETEDTKAEYYKKQSSIFGHLMSDNRLCVSVSRQKRFLALVGDSDLFNTQIARDAVPALKNYFDLCVKHGGVYEYREGDF